MAEKRMPMSSRPSGYSDLHKAARKGDHKQVAKLINEGTNVNDEFGCGVTPLHLACLFGHNEVIKCLLSQGAGVNLYSRNGLSLLHSVCPANAREDVVTILTKNGADVNARDREGKSVLHYALKGSRNEVVHILLANAADVNIYDNHGQSAFDIATEMGNLEIQNAILEARSSNGKACSNCSISKMKERQDKLEEQLVSMQNSLKKYFDLENELSNLKISHKREIEKIEENVASKKSHSQDRVAIKQSNNYNTSTNSEAPVFPLLKPANNEDFQEVQSHCKQVAKVDIQDPKGRTSLELSREKQVEAYLDVLLNNRQSFTTRNECGETALHIAASGGHINRVRKLIDQGADVNALDEEMKSPLHNAAKWGYNQVGEMLLTNGAKPFGNDREGKSPLHYACIGGYEILARCLVAYGARVNVKTYQGCTPLHIASEIGNRNLCKFLIDEGAEINVFTNFDETPLDLAGNKYTENFLYYQGGHYGEHSYEDDEDWW